jgi:hypothetical protein
MDEKIDLFFNDYSLAPAFIQQNYIGVRPMNCDPFSHMDRFDRLFVYLALN